jgi:hypothetical protein
MQYKFSSLKHFALGAWLLLASNLNYGQENTPGEPPEQNRTSRFYHQLSSGLHLPVYRDFATSPLFYDGFGFYQGSGRLKRSDQKERLLKIGLSLSAVAARVPESDFIQPGAMGTFGNFQLYYLRLWKLEKLSSDKNNVKVGGALVSTQNFRSNSSLQNNALGLENLTNLMGSFQVTRDISRKVPKQLNLWLLKPTLQPVERELRFLFNTGLLNFNYRPGYAYSFDAEIVGEETDPLFWVLSDYRWSLNGWRLQTELEYITYLGNGNARSFAYVWEAAHAPGRHEAFQMASHQFRFTYYFFTKKR